MEVKEVVRLAVDYVADVFSDEEPSNLGLEEITFSEANGTWNVTIGFSRPWDYQAPGLVAGLQPKQPGRQFKVVEVSDQEEKVKAIRIRE